MPDIEFLPENVGGADDAEELSGSRHLPRRLIVAGALALCALVAVAATIALTSGGGSHRPPAALPSQHPSGRPSAVRSVVADPVSGLRPVFVGPYSGEPVLAVAVAGSSAWLLQADGLHVVPPPGGRRFRLPLPPALQDARLVADPGAHLVWLVAKGVARAYDTRTVRLAFAAQVPPYTDVTALDGRLYVVSGDAVLAVGPGQRLARPVLSTTQQLAAITADQAAHRLVVADYSTPARLWLLTPRGYRAAHVDRTGVAELMKPSLGAAGGALWIAGFDTGNGVLLRLDPTTLQTIARSSLEQVLEPGAIIAASGTASIWVREGGGGSLLRCIDAATGTPEQTWPVTGPIASSAGTAVVGTSFGGLYLGLERCRG
jgi:hypothetical protein